MVLMIIAKQFKAHPDTDDLEMVTGVALKTAEMVKAVKMAKASRKANCISAGNFPVYQIIVISYFIYAD